MYDIPDEAVEAAAPVPFVLLRKEDETGVSGTGVVAEGVEFSDGTVALRWTSQWPTSVVFHDRGIESVEHVHGHGGKTKVVRFDFNQQALASLRHLMRATRAEAENARLRAVIEADERLIAAQDRVVMLAKLVTAKTPDRATYTFTLESGLIQQFKETLSAAEMVRYARQHDSIAALSDEGKPDE